MSDTLRLLEFLENSVTFSLSSSCVVPVCVGMWRYVSGWVSGMSGDSTGLCARVYRVCVYVCVSDGDKRPCSLDPRVTQRWQIVSLSLPLITALDPNCEFHLQTARFDGQMFVQLRKGVQAEYFLSKYLHSCFYFLCFISLYDELSFGLVLFPLGKKRKTHQKLFPLRVFYCHHEMGAISFVLRV